MRDGFRIVFLAAVGLTAASPLFAHHGNAAYDNAGKVTLKGTVTEWIWANPHCWLKFDVKDDKGNVVHWVAEDSAPASIVNLGFTRQSFKPGDEVTVTVITSKNNRPIGRVQQVVLANGTILSEGNGLAAGSESGAQPATNTKPSN
jgi:predicted extracellular nuclease